MSQQEQLGSNRLLRLDGDLCYHLRIQYLCSMPLLRRQS
ncbi:Uncharacterised protein [Vibrio cholerae]|nr:Uncharacterised protein [Vibrio cholerae]CSD29157.1 Uncharacterised protein [Vibrio cholerae]CSD52571.1 Uncharacterised protein [Vibrio cholerae]CSI64819.1 Uncharacterised protein [Vibrio cholerae]CSI76684.1 Uncharacterised protein [Vibrio cholerae]